jgi:hypothetical protein
MRSELKSSSSSSSSNSSSSSAELKIPATPNVDADDEFLSFIHSISETKEKDHQLAELKWIEEQRKNAAEEARASADEVRAAAEEVRKDRRLSLEEKAQTYLSDKLAFDIAVFNAKK